MHAVIAAADELGERLIGVLGDPGYYVRFGFVAATRLNVRPPDAAWGPHFQALALSDRHPAVTGTFRYAPPFDDVIVRGSRPPIDPEVSHER